MKNSRIAIMKKMWW